MPRTATVSSRRTLSGQMLGIERRDDPLGVRKPPTGRLRSDAGGVAGDEPQREGCQRLDAGSAHELQRFGQIRVRDRAIACGSGKQPRADRTREHELVSDRLGLLGAQGRLLAG